MKECPICHRCFADRVNHCGTDGALLVATIPGDNVLDGRYELKRRLGQGGMGAVYEARHSFLKTVHAIKVILPEFLVGNDPEFVRRFRQEAMAAANIRHPNVIRVTDYGLSGGTTPFLVMDFIRGMLLQEILIQEKRLSPERSLEIMEPVMAGVGAAHRLGVVHRDLKPLNIIIEDGLPLREAVKVLDFGLAKIKTGELLGSFVAAKSSGIMGSPPYMAPEQWSDEEFDSRTDIYSLGIILYQMLTGSVPFKGPSAPTVMKKHLMDEPPRFAESGVFVPPQVEAVVRHALEKNPANRPQTVDELIGELRAAINETRPQRTQLHAAIPASQLDTLIPSVADIPPTAQVPVARGHTFGDAETVPHDSGAEHLSQEAEAATHEPEAAERRRRLEQERIAAEQEARRKREEEEAAARRREEEEAARRRAEEEAAARKREEEEAAARKREEEAAARKREEEAAARRAEEEVRRREAEAAARAAAEARRREEAEQREREAEAARLAEQERLRKEAERKEAERKEAERKETERREAERREAERKEAERKAAEEEARRRAAEAAEEERRRQLEEERRREAARAAELERLRLEEEARRKQEEEEAARKREEEEAARRRQEEEAVRKREEEAAARRREEEEAARRRAEEEAAARKREEEAAARKREEEAAARRAEEEARRREAEAAARAAAEARRREEAERREREAEAARLAEQERLRKEAERREAERKEAERREAERKEAERRAAEEEARRRAAEAAELKRREEEGRRAAEEEQRRRAAAERRRWEEEEAKRLAAAQWAEQQASATTIDVQQSGEARDARKSYLPVIAVILVVMLLGGMGILYLLFGPGERSVPPVNSGTIANANVGGASPAPATPSGPEQAGVAPAERQPYRPELVEIRGGVFRMGRSDVPVTSPQYPAHEVSVNSFMIDRTEVTNAEYAEFVRETGYQRPRSWKGDTPPAGEEMLPVVNVSFQDAQAFAQWRSRRDGVTYRLPTEEEWEFAARGRQNNLYPWGNEWADDRVNLSGEGPRPVGSFPNGASAGTGVLDLIGNVWEWTSSEASVYPGNDKLEVDKGGMIVRGGSYRSMDEPAIKLRGSREFPATWRQWIEKSDRNPTLGFRLVRSLP